MKESDEEQRLTDLARRGSRLQSAEAEALEAQLARQPEDLDARAMLLGYHALGGSARSPRRGADALAANEDLARHAAWWVENQPASSLAWLATAAPAAANQLAARFERLWLAAVERQGSDPRVLANAAVFHSRHAGDADRARELLERAVSLEPTNAEWVRRLAHLIETQGARWQRLRAGSPDEHRAKALELRKAAARLEVDPAKRPGDSMELAKASLDAGDLDGAEASARDALEALSAAARDWNYGNVHHHAHIVLGRVALRREDVERAKRHLLEAGRTPGSPQLKSFGPNLALAKELLERGERAIVLEYLDLLESFWTGPNHEQTLLGWRGMIERGKVPDFGANLVY